MADSIWPDCTNSKIDKPKRAAKIRGRFGVLFGKLEKTSSFD